MEKQELINTTETYVRFSEVDSMAVVWHGNYVKYLEDGREAFGREFGMGYNDVFEKGFMTPIVKLDINYTKQTKYGEQVVIETKFVRTDAAKIIFDYKIWRKSDNAVVLKARSIQVFIDLKGEMEISNPEFYIQWQRKFGLL
ncbi:MAG: acyl-CoA thioesterase [Prolixibacteraceae bacterium]|nr:acyl-CoA thioesterase [Prolixibacteraceae bacterium]